MRIAGADDARRLGRAARIRRRGVHRTPSIAAVQVASSRSANEPPGGPPLFTTRRSSPPRDAAAVVDRVFGTRRGRQVGRDREPADSRRRVVEPGPGPGGQGDPRPLAGELARDRAPEAARRAADQRAQPVQSEIHRLMVRAIAGHRGRSRAGLVRLRGAGSAPPTSARSRAPASSKTNVPGGQRNGSGAARTAAAAYRAPSGGRRVTLADAGSTCWTSAAPLAPPRTHQIEHRDVVRWALRAGPRRAVAERGDLRADRDDGDRRVQGRRRPGHRDEAPPRAQDAARPDLAG